MKKMLFSVLMVLALTLALALGVSGAEVVETGNLTDTVCYTLYVDGKMVIEGTGELPGYYYDLGGYFYDIFPNVTRIEVGEGITSLEANCFYNLRKLQSVSLPSTLKTIGSSAFGNCRELQRVVLTEGLQFIGQDAFMNSHELTSILIPASVAEIGDTAFSGCPKLKEVVFQGLPPVMSEMAFFRDWDPGITVYYPANSGWSKEHLLYFGENTTWISYTIDSQGNRIPDESSAYAAQLLMKTSGTFSSGGYWNVDSDGVLTIGGAGEISPNSLCDAYWKNITKVVIDSDVNSLYYYFSDCESLTAVVIQSPMWTYPGFYGCNALTDISFPEGMTFLSCELMNCASLKEIKIPSDVKSIGNQVFYECIVLEKVTFLGNAPSSIGEGCFNKGVGEITFFYPADDPSWTEETMQKLCSSTGIWIPYTVDESGTMIPHSELEKRFAGVVWVEESGNAIATLNSEGTLRVEGEGIWDVRMNYAKVRRLELGDGITGVGEEVFYGSGITEINLNNVVSVGNRAFMRCEDLETVTFGSELKSIGEFAFDGCNSLKEAILPEGLEELGYCAFYDCAKLSSVVIPGSLKKISDSCFQNCANLSTVVLNEGLEQIGNNAFNRSGIKEIVIPSTVYDIGAFECPNSLYGSTFANTPLEKITFLTEKLSHIPGSCFAETSLQEITIPEGVTKIGDWAFDNSKLQKVEFPNSLEEIGLRAFSMTELNVVILPSTLKSLGMDCFGWCPNLSVIVFKGDYPEIGCECGCIYGSSPIFAYSEEYEERFKSLKLEGDFLRGTIPFSYDESGNMVVEEWNMGTLSDKLASAKTAYTEGYTLGQYSISELNMTNQIGYGSQAFAYILSDLLYENMPSELDYTVEFDEVVIGDIFRLPGNSRSLDSGRAVVVTDKYEDYVLVAQGDWKKNPDDVGTVHWGEKLSREQVESAEYRITRQVRNLLTESWTVPTYEPQRPAISGNITEEAVQNLILSLKDSYPEGYPYTMDITYTSNTGYTGTACSAFAYWISDMAFGTAPMRILEEIEYNNIMVGDILQYDPDPGDNTTHVVVVLEVYKDCVVTVEANYNDSVHWGSVFTRKQVENMLQHYSRYPEGTTHAERVEYTGEIPDANKINGFFEIDKVDTVVETEYTVFDVRTGQKQTFNYEIPEDGAVMMIFFFEWCGYSRELLYELNGCEWLDNPALEVIAIESEGASQELMAEYINSVTPDSAQYIDYFTTDQKLHYAYQNTYVGDSLSSPCIIIITETDGVPIVTRTRSGIISAEAIRLCLTNISEGFTFYEGHEHDFVFKRTVKPTCDEQGYAVYHCDCGKEEHRDFVDALGHSWVEATCAAPKTCSVCQKTEGAALKHEYQNEICIHCGEEMKGIMGDLDGNGKLSYNDALVILRGSIGLVKLDDTQKLLADVDGNGIVNYNDALTVLRRSIGLA